MAHVVPLTSSFLSAVLVEETAFALSQSQAETEVHKLNGNTKEETLLDTTGLCTAIQPYSTTTVKQNFKASVRFYRRLLLLAVSCLSSQQNGENGS